MNINDILMNIKKINTKIKSPARFTYNGIRYDIIGEYENRWYKIGTIRFILGGEFVVTVTIDSVNNRFPIFDDGSSYQIGGITLNKKTLAMKSECRALIEEIKEYIGKDYDYAEVIEMTEHSCGY